MAERDRDSSPDRFNLTKNDQPIKVWSKIDFTQDDSCYEGNIEIGHLRIGGDSGIDVVVQANFEENEFFLMSMIALKDIGILDALDVIENQVEGAVRYDVETLVIENEPPEDFVSDKSYGVTQYHSDSDDGNIHLVVYSFNKIQNSDTEINFQYPDGISVNDEQLISNINSFGLTLGKIINALAVMRLDKDDSGESSLEISVPIKAAKACAVVPEGSEVVRRSEIDPSVRGLDIYQNYVDTDMMPNIDSLVGLDREIDVLRAALDDRLEPELLEKYRLDPISSVLLVGPAGTGKTTLIRALAHDVEANLFEIAVPDVLSKWVGRTDKHLVKVFDEAEKFAEATDCLSVLFFDEADGLFAEGAGGNVGGSMTFQATAKQLFTSLRYKYPKVLLVLACNTTEKIPAALLRPGRIDSIIEFHNPDLEVRVELFNKMVEERIEHFSPTGFSESDTLEVKLDTGDYAAQTEGFSGADIKDVFDTLMRRKLRNFRKNRDDLEMLNGVDLERAINEVKMRKLQGK